MCRRGQENLHCMTKDWFDVLTTTEGSTYVMQIKDELDKNHCENDQDLTNQGRMYEVPGK